MKSIILAAAFPKKLYPHIRNIPKPLFPIGGWPIIELILSKIRELKEIDEIIVVTNTFYKEQFNEWKNKRKIHTSDNITIISNGSNTRQESRGALSDLNFVLKHQNLRMTYSL